MITAKSLKNLGEASEEDQLTIGWILSRMQVELSGYMRQGIGEPGPKDIHALAERKVQVYINSLLRELTITRR